MRQTYLSFLLRPKNLVLLALAAVIAVPVCIYIAAPVEGLRRSVSYTDPYNGAQRKLGLGHKNNLRLEAMSPELIFATLAAEDPEFAWHNGLRPGKLKEVGAKYMKEGGRVSGASTLTQQIAKNVYTDASRSLWRKAFEGIYALKIERHFTKEEIFILYANMVNTGPGIYGYGNAARAYFHKAPGRLWPMESVFIVNSLPSPIQRTAFLREGTTDKGAYRRLSYLYWKTMLLEAEWMPFGKLTNKDKRHLFSSYMQEPGHAVCLSDDTKERIRIKAGYRAAAFIQAARMRHGVSAGEAPSQAPPPKTP